MIDKLSMEIIKHMKTVMSEKTIVEFFLDIENHERKVKSIGYVNDIPSKFKNEFFDEIYEDEDGNIVDLRIFEEEPTTKEIDEMASYWIKLQKTFQKPVQPCFVITGKR